tara:strand:+ start:1350 stop:6047 length:4698 start_codon:yes stop_codon:yes gene_type:complete
VPKKTLQVGKFEKGIINSVDKKDIPEGGVSNATGLMFDVPGQIRQMGAESIHRTLDSVDDISGSITPGYGLFAFNSDFNVSDNFDIPSKMLAVQQDTKIGIINQTSTGTYATVSNEIDLKNTSASTTQNPSPIFIFIDGQLKVSNINFDQTVFDYTKSYSYIRKCWFQHLASASDRIQIPDSYDDTVSSHTATNGQGDWIASRSYIFPPSVHSSGLISHQLYSSSSNSLEYGTSPQSALESGAAGSISLTVACTDNANDEDTGEWTTGTYSFGISFQYDNNQESQVTSFAHDFTTSNMNDNTPMAFKLFASIDSDTAGFDRRLAGINLYWTGDDDGKFDDPLFLAYWHWGSSSEDLSYFESHAGDRIESSGITHSNDVYVAGGTSSTLDGQSNAGLIISTLPAITFEIRNGYSNESKSIAAKYKSIVVANRRAYIGGVKQYEFGTGTINADGNCAKETSIVSTAAKLDRMIKSPVNQFDVFPEENFIDVAVNDGESITHLAAYNGRLLQFKEGNLYIINISEDIEYLENQYKYLGVNSGYQVVETDIGIAWVNPSGCYIYSENGISTISENILFGAAADETQFGIFSSWSEFIGTSGMIGYIPLLKQLVVFQDPTTSQDLGHILIFDLKTKSWTYGKNKVTGKPKSNVISNYDNSCLYISQSVLESFFSRRTSRESIPGIDARWKITNLSGDNLTTTNLKYTLGTNGSTTQVLADFTNDTINDENAATLKQRIIHKINNVYDYYQNNRKSFIVQEDSSGNIIITRPAHLISTDHTNADPSTVMNYSGQDLTQTGTITDDNTITISQKSTGEGSTTLPNYEVHFQAQTFLVDNTIYRLKIDATALRYNTGADDLPWNQGPRTENILDLSLVALHTSLKPVILDSFPADPGYNVDNILTFEGENFYEQGNPFNMPYSIRTNSVYTNGSTTGDNSIRESYASWKFSSSTENINLGSFTGGAITIGNSGVFGGSETSPYGYLYGVKLDGRFLIEYVSENPLYSDGSPLTSGSLISPSGPVGVDNSALGNSGPDKNEAFAPSVVFRNLQSNNSDTDSDLIVITMIGDYTDYFAEGDSYKMENNNFNTIHGTSGNVLRNCTVSNVDIISRTDGFGGHSGMNINVPGSHVTIIKFKRSDQLDTGSLSDNIINRWDNVKTYGSQSDVTFTRESFEGGGSLGAIDNSEKTGLANVAKKVSLNPRWGGTVLPSSIISITATDHGGTTDTVSYTVTANDYIMDATAGALTAFNNNTSFQDGVSWSTIAQPSYDNTIRWFIGNDGTDNGALVRVALDLASEGISVGDYIEWSTLDFAFFIKTIYDFNKDKSGGSDVGYTWFEIDKTKTMIKGGGTDGNLSSGTLITGDNTYNDTTPTDSNDHLINSSAYPTAKFSNIVITGLRNEINNPNAIDGNIELTQSVNVNEFVNDPGYQNLLDVSSHEISLETKEFDFGSPGTTKVLYYVDISYKCQLRDFDEIADDPMVLQFQASLNGNTNNLMSLYTSKEDLNNNPNFTGLHNTNNIFVTRRYYFSQNKSTKKAKTLALHINPLSENFGDYAISSFVVNDINICIRDLNR